MNSKDKVEKTPASDYDGIEDRFSDTFETHINPWSASVTFGVRATRAEEPNSMNLRIRMPLEQAKVLGFLLLHGIRRYEGTAGVLVNLPRQVLEDLKIPLEDWENFPLSDAS